MSDKAPHTPKRDATNMWGLAMNGSSSNVRAMSWVVPEGTASSAS